MQTLTATTLGARELGRRSRFETHIDVLRAVANGAVKPTHIMYKANLSWTALQEYLDALTQNGMIEVREVNARKMYGLTQKGFEVLNSFFALKRQMGPSEPTP